MTALGGGGALTAMVARGLIQQNWGNGLQKT